MKTLVLGLMLLGCASVAEARSGPAAVASSVTAGANSAGLTLKQDCTGTTRATIAAKAGAPATVKVQVSGDEVVWFDHITLLSAASGDAILEVTLGFPAVRVTSATTGVALDFAIGCQP